MQRRGSGYALAAAGALVLLYEILSAVRRRLKTSLVAGCQKRDPIGFAQSTGSFEAPGSAAVNLVVSWPAGSPRGGVQ